MHGPSLAALAHPRRGDVMVVAAAMFVLGTAMGATVNSSLWSHAAAVLPTSALQSEQAPIVSSGTTPQISEPRLAYPADVVRIIDGDTFEARVQVWPGLDVTTKVRLRGIDAPELHARCDDERARAEAARAALATILAEGDVAISRVGLDKYGGRVDAVVSTRATSDVSAALLNGGFARRYDGGRRGSWC